jgi:NADH-quinone oxidoreductase subunit M
MVPAESTPLKHTEPAPLRPAVFAGLMAAALVAGVLARFLGAWLPVFLAAAVAALAARGRSWSVRAPLAVIAALLALMVVRLWPESAVESTTAPPTEAAHLLTFIIGVPIAGALVMLVLPRHAERWLEAATLLIMGVTLTLALPLLRVPMGREFHFNENVAWLPGLGVHYHVAIDGITLWLVMLTVFITPIATFASFGSIHTRVKDWCFALLLLEGAMLGALLALDLFVFFVFWELMLVPMYVMIGVWGGTARVRSAVKFFLYTMFGSIFMLGAILYVGYAYARASGGVPSFDYFELQRLLIPRHVQLWLWSAFTLAFIIKVPMFPFHTWLPDAHTEAPTAGSVILAAVMLKMGTYGYMRFSMGLFPEASVELAANLAGAAVVLGIVYGAFCAWKQEDVKRLIAYSSVAHLGYVMLGLFALSQASLEGSVLQMVNHGVSTGMLFILFGVIYDRRHTRHIEEFGGLAKPMPVYAALFIVATLASIGLPTTNGFVGEFMIITGTFTSTHLGHFAGIQAGGAAFGVILGAVYMLMVVEKLFFGPVTKKENATLADVNGRELLALAPLAMMIFVIGLFPNIFLSQIRGAAARVQDDVETRAQAIAGGRYYEGPLKLLPLRPEAPARPASESKTN